MFYAAMMEEAKRQGEIAGFCYHYAESDPVGVMRLFVRECRVASERNRNFPGYYAVFYEASQEVANRERPTQHGRD